MHEAMRKLILLLAFGLTVLLLAGCSNGGFDRDPDDEGEGGVIGTGLILQGTVTDVRAFASNSLQIKSSTGEVSGAVIDDTGRYRVPAVKGAPPYLLRADLGNSEYRYGIAFGKERTNVNSYTNVILQNWFEGNNGDLDSEFEQASIATDLPTRVQYQNTANKFFGLVALVLEDYELDGNQLLVGDYDSGTVSDGIDNYLRKNPVLVRGDSISFVITDPFTEIQSTLDTGIALYELPTQPDTEAPTTPANVRALASTDNDVVNEVVVVWDPSSDNRGVFGYEVFRDGALIATTPYPVHRDSDLEPNRQYTYEVRAVDASQNSSALSLSVVADTLAVPDNVAPAAPVQLEVTPSIGRMDLTWQVQADIADVVRFEVYRGRDNNPVNFLASVTGTIFTDVSVASGVNYCYEIAAVDASDNTSNRGVEFCITAPGEEVLSAVDLPIPTVPLDAGLNIPVTESTPCTENWTEFSVDSPTQVGEGCYLVASPINVNDAGSLNFAPGVVMKFAAGTGVVVNTGGSLSSEGTKAAPVVLTGQDPTPGYWNGINFNQSNSSRNKLVNTVVEYAGGGETMAAVAVSSSMGPLSRVDISGSVIRNCLGTGIRADTEFGTVNRLDGTVISGCGIPLDIHLTGLSGVTQRNDFTGNNSDIIGIGNATIDSDMQLADLGVPYVSSGIRVADGNLKILDGVEIQFTSGASLIVSGSLTADGREDSRVKLTGTVKERGHWFGLAVNGNASLNYADIEYGGFGAGRAVAPASLRIGQGVVSLSNVLISESSLYAIHLNDAAGRISNIENVVISGNSKAILIGLSQLDQLSDQLVFLSNDSSTIELTTTEVTNLEVDLLDFGVPYLLSMPVQLSNGSFRVRPGVTLFMGDGVSVGVSNTASFIAVGTAEEPITLTNQEQLAGAWVGITVSSNSNLNRIEHTKIAFAGGSFGGTGAAVKLNCDPQAMLFLANSTIEDSAGWGVVSDEVNGCALAFGENVQFNRNRFGDIGVE